MFEENINKIVEETNDLLDILKSYVDYYITFKIEREFYRRQIFESVTKGLSDFELGHFRFQVYDSIPREFSFLEKAYREGVSKGAMLSIVNHVNGGIENDIRILYPSIKLTGKNIGVVVKDNVI